MDLTLKFSVFLLAVQGARNYAEFRLVQKFCYPELDEKKLITTQHQQWDRWQDTSAAWSIPPEHWRKSTSMSSASSSADVSRVLDNAAVSSWALIWMLLFWAGRANRPATQLRATQLLEEISSKFFEGTVMSIFMDTSAAALILVVILIWRSLRFYPRDLCLSLVLHFCILGLVVLRFAICD